MLVYIIVCLKITIYGHDSCICMHDYSTEWLYNREHYHMTIQPHWPYMVNSLLYTRHLSCICMRVWPAEWLYSCVHTLSHDYATIYGSCICITHGAKVRHLRTIPIYVRGPVIINRHFDMIHIQEPIWGRDLDHMTWSHGFHITCHVENLGFLLDYDSNAGLPLVNYFLHVTCHAMTSAKNIKKMVKMLTSYYYGTLMRYGNFISIVKTLKCLAKPMVC